MFHVISLINVQLNEITDSWNLCWQSSVQNKPDYHYFTIDHLKAYILINKISLKHSIGLFCRGRLIGLSFLGLKESEGWIASLGIIPEYRRKGLSKVLLYHQMAECDTLRLTRITLEVKRDAFISKVYELFGFKQHQRLSNFVLSKKDLYFLDIDRYYRYCYQKVLAEPYFTARRELNLIFSWRRQENVIQNYQQNTYYLGPERLSGYVANSRGILLDIWARSAHAAESALSSVSAQLDPIVIHNQIQDAVLTFLVHHSIQPVTVHHEMIWHLKKLESNNLQIGSISWT